MTKTKSTKRALFTSVISLLVCVSMLVGSTFAWFTDSAATGVNKIQAGTLEIDLVDKDGNSLEGKTLDFVKAEGHEGEAILWEPGCTYTLPDVFVVNKGNLALKYKILISGINGDAKLNDAIDWTIQLDGAELADEYSLDAGETSKALTISGNMKNDAGNEYQGLSINGISITVVATQNTVEYDSNDNTYDEGAELPTALVEVNGVVYKDLQSAINAAKTGDTITLKGDVVCDTTISIDKSVTLDLGEHTITSTDAMQALRIVADESIDVTINATTGGIVATGYAIYSGCVDLNNPNIDSIKTNVVINGGNYVSKGLETAIYANNGVCTINGGSYKADGVSDKANGEDVFNTLVLNNKDYFEGSFMINGGKFYGFNPACLSINKGEHHNHDAIATGKTGVLDADGWFTVAEGNLNYIVKCECSAPASAHGHCYASKEDAEVMRNLHNCPYDKLYEIDSNK